MKSCLDGQIIDHIQIIDMNQIESPLSTNVYLPSGTCQYDFNHSVSVVYMIGFTANVQDMNSTYTKLVELVKHIVNRGCLTNNTQVWHQNIYIYIHYIIMSVTFVKIRFRVWLTSITVLRLLAHL
jgi:hypothetical protein